MQSEEPISFSSIWKKGREIVTTTLEVLDQQLPQGLAKLKSAESRVQPLIEPRLNPQRAAPQPPTVTSAASSIGLKGENNNLRSFARNQVLPSFSPIRRALDAIPLYKHQSLDCKPRSFRLLSLLPGSENDPISILFSSQAIIGETHYEALSYTWGTPEPASFIRAFGETNSGCMKVTPNLEAALRRLRLPDRERVLWIDALCINQEESSEEKESQIRQMDLIYSEAQEVIVWLGEASENSDMGMKFISQMSDLSKLDEMSSSREFLIYWTALGALMRRPWFSRRWVVQELASARTATVYCGPDTVAWAEFADAVSLFHAKLEKIQSLFDQDSFMLGEIQGLGAHSLVTISQGLFAHSGRTRDHQSLATLEYLLSTMSVFQVTNPWDTIFALLSLAKDVRRDDSYADEEMDNRNDLLSIAVEYGRPIENLFATVVRDIIGQRGVTDIICQPWAPPAAQIRLWYKTNRPATYGENPDLDSFYKMSSWIRDTGEAEFAPRSDKFGVQHDRINAKPFIGQSGFAIYNAAAGSRISSERCQLKYSVDANVRGSHVAILILSGYRVDRIGRLGGYAQGGGIPPDWLDLANWMNHTTSPAPNNFWRTLVADRGIGGDRPPAWYRRACEHAWSDTASPGLDTRRIQRNSKSSMTSDFIRRVRQTVWNRQMFVTTDGRLGLGPSNSHSSSIVRENDFIYVLDGCSVPVILRDHPSGEYYTLVGECYVHGIMDGEAYEECQKSGQARSEIWLR